jgi:hypothetical protein
MSVFLIILSLQNRTLATALQLTVATDQPIYNLGNPITIGGNLTLNGNPVSDGLVTVEILDPKGQMIVLETLTTGTDPPQPTTIEITELFTCTSAGHQKTSFPQGSDMGLALMLKNNDMTKHSVKVYVYIQYSNRIPFTVFLAQPIDIDGGSTIPILDYPISISSSAPLGVASVYACALTALPTEGGYAWGPGAQTTFTITSPGGGGQATNENKFASAESSQAYSLVFAVNPYGGVLGYYTIYAISMYPPYVASSTAQFAATLITDITGGPGGAPDGIVDVSDIAFVVACFGSISGHGNYDSRADFNKDGVIDVSDVALVVGDFGKWSILP